MASHGEPTTIQWTTSEEAPPETVWYVERRLGPHEWEPVWIGEDTTASVWPLPNMVDKFRVWGFTPAGSRIDWAAYREYGHQVALWVLGPVQRRTVTARLVSTVSVVSIEVSVRL